MSKYAIEVKDVKKSFFLPNHKNDSIKTAITQAFKPKEKGGKTFNALDGISFKVEKGDFFGILGRNGSGKSTLLKIISEIYQPTSGSVKHDGKLVSFIELGVGFKAELSGRENVYLNGGLLGFSKQEVDAMYDDIVSFAELEDFMDQKLKNYSSGMKVRLAFSVAIRSQADILILDEVLAVGDAAFQKKCYDYFRTLKDDGKTVILVTHGMGAVRDFCNKAIVIDNGKIKFEGRADEAANEYLALFDKSKEKNLPKAESALSSQFESVNVEPSYNEDYISFNMAITPSTEIKDPVIALLIHKGKEQVYRWVSDEGVDEDIVLEAGKKFEANLKLQNIFPTGRYTVSVMVRRGDRQVDYGIFSDIASFKVINHTEYRHRILWRPNEVFEVLKNV